MNVRLAKLEDVPDIVRLGERLVRRSAFAHTAISYKTCVNRLVDAIRNPWQWLGVAEHRGVVVGFLLLVRVRYWWSDRDYYILDDGIYAERPGAGAALVRKGLQWAAQWPDTKEVIIAVNSGIEVDRTARVLNRCGLRDRGITVSVRLRGEVERVAA